MEGTKNEDRGGLSLGKEMIRVLHRKEEGVAFFQVLKTVKSRGADGEHNLGTSTEDSRRKNLGNGKQPRNDQEYISSTGCKNKENVRRMKSLG